MLYVPFLLSISRICMHSITITCYNQDCLITSTDQVSIVSRVFEADFKSPRE